MGHRVYTLLGLLLWLPLVGCGQSEEPAAVPTPKRASAPAAESAATPAGNSAQPDEAETEPQSSRVAEFVPPFPERDLFLPPKRAQSTVRRDDAGETVELKGFVHVDQPKVVLAIDGVISPIAEGGEKYGVHVISIQPPSVVLQRGRNRWTATLE